MDATTLPTRHRTFRAMGTDVSLVADRRADARAFERAARSVRLVFASEELRFSRFRADSELARVNARAGRPPAGIELGVEDPESFDDELARVRLDHGALATSCVTKRAWGPALHHLIDPRTDAAADGDVLQATVWAPTGAEAEVLAKVALLEGPPALDRMVAMLVQRDGTVVTTITGARDETAA